MERHEWGRAGGEGRQRWRKGGGELRVTAGEEGVEGCEDI